MVLHNIFETLVKPNNTHTIQDRKLRVYFIFEANNNNNHELKQQRTKKH